MKKRNFIALGIGNVIGSLASSKLLALPANALTAPKIKFAYDLREFGWSNFTLIVENKFIDVGPFSYATNALDDLIMTGILAVPLTPTLRASFDRESVERHMILNVLWKPLATLRLLSFSDIKANLPDECGRVEFEARINLDDYARAIQNVAHEIWNKYGEQGYFDILGGYRGFPKREMATLDAALSAK